MFRGECGQGGGCGRNREVIECFRCHKLGHFQYECPDGDKRANYAEMEEDVLLMVHVEVNSTKK